MNKNFSILPDMFVRTRHLLQLSLLAILMSVLIIACQGTPEQNLASPSSVTEIENCRRVNHKAGETCVPNHPERVVTLSVPTLADALAVGVKPVGTIFSFEEPPPYLEGKLDGIERVGTGDQPNLETILALDPDVIIGLHYAAESVYNQLSQISPTVLHDWQGYPSWKDHVNFVAKALGKTEEAKEAWARYDQRIAELREALGDRYQDIEISVVRVCCNNLASDVKNSFSGTILNDAGLRRPPAQDSAPNGLIFTSEELITETLNGDIIFAIVDDEDDSEKAFEQLKQNPLWNQLKAVQAGKVYPVNLPTWHGGNLLAADGVIDDLFKYLVERQTE